MNSFYGLIHSEPFFKVLLISRNSSTTAYFRENIEVAPGVEKMVITRDLEAAAVVFKEQDLRVGKNNGCLLFVIDLCSWELERVEKVLAQFHALRWSGNYVVCLLEKERPDLTYKAMTDQIACEVIFRGSLGEFGDFWKKTVLSPSEGALNLSLPFPKRPSAWLRQFKHDYFNFFIAHRTEIKVAGLLGVQREIDYLQNVIRNILAFPDTNSPARFLKPNTEELECVLARQASEIRAILVCSEEIGSQMPEHFRPGRDFVCYQAVEQIPRLIAESSVEERNCILVGKEEMIPYVPEYFSEAQQKPVFVLVAEKHAQKEARTWQARFRQRHLVGVFSYEDLIPIAEKQHPFELKRSYWKILTLISLEEIFIKLKGLLEETFQGIQSEISQTAQQKIFNSWAAVTNANALYLGCTLIGVKNE